MKEKIITFVNDVIKEMKKVTWPSQEDLKDYTTIVIASTVIISLLVMIIDKFFQEILTALF
ncbi:MAG: preprotein translocase subunit SecE [Chlorobi bacterium]|nr:preprotein translocase subunit SecE [Chlorobiota bacterium]